MKKSIDRPATIEADVVPTVGRVSEDTASMSPSPDTEIRRRVGDVTGPLQIAIMRYRGLPVLLRPEPASRAWLVTVVDCWDGGFLGADIVEDTPTDGALTRAFEFAVAPKNPGRKRYPGCRNGWERSGAPELLILEDHLGLAGPKFRASCRAEGTHLQIDHVMPTELQLLDKIEKTLPMIAQEMPGHDLPSVPQSLLSMFATQAIVDILLPSLSR